jgi:hypothetical protein
VSGGGGGLGRALILRAGFGVDSGKGGEAGIDERGVGVEVEVETGGMVIVDVAVGAGSAADTGFARPNAARGE